MEYSKMHLDTSLYIEVAENYYAEITSWRGKFQNERHLELCLCINKRRKNLIFTGQSACTINGIPRLEIFEMRPHCMTTKGRHADIICWREGPADPNVRVVNGLLVVSPERAIVDIAKDDSPHSLLVSINHCLNKKLFTKEQLLTEIDRRNFKGKNKLKKVLRFASDKCDSPLETVAWIHINNAGFILPEQQVNLYDNKKFIGRVDMYWNIKGRKIILELDGMNKYTEAEVLRAEKIREDKLLGRGYELIRAMWEDAENGKLIKRLEKVGIPKRKYYRRDML